MDETEECDHSAFDGAVSITYEVLYNELTVICLLACCVSISTAKDKVQACGVSFPLCFSLQWDVIFLVWCATVCRSLGFLAAGWAAAQPLVLRALGEERREVSLPFHLLPVKGSERAGWRAGCGAGIALSLHVRYFQLANPVFPAQGTERVWSCCCTCSSALFVSKTTSSSFQEESQVLSHSSGTAKVI